MPRKKAQAPESPEGLELQVGSPGTDDVREENDGPPPMDAEVNVSDETAQSPAEPDSGPPAVETSGGKLPKEVSGSSKGIAKRSRRSSATKRETGQDGRSSEQRPRPSARIPRLHPDDVLSLDMRDDIVAEDDTEETVWHEVRNAYRIRRFLTGTLCGVEETAENKTIAVLDYKGLRIVIPMKEMMLRLERAPSGGEYISMMKRQAQVLSTMLGAELDFMVKGLDSKAKAVVASRKDAMLRKRQTFYMDTDSTGIPRVYVGRVVQARVIAVAEKVVRVEVFGVECSILARDLSWEWIGDARERFSVGDKVLVRIQEVNVISLENITIQVDIRSVSSTTSRERLKLCRVEGKYAGTVTDVRRGVVYIRLNNGVNAIAHSCYDYRMPGKKDTVSFAVTKIDMESCIAVGIITRIIKQNL